MNYIIRKNWNVFSLQFKNPSGGMPDIFIQLDVYASPLLRLNHLDRKESNDS